MHIIARVVFMMIAVFGVVIGAVRVFSASGVPLSMALFANPDGTPCQRPCIFGINPDTDLETARRLLAMHPFTRHFAQETDSAGVVFTHLDTSVTYLVPSARRKPLQPTISVDFAPGLEPTDNPGQSRAIPLVALGDVIRLFGPPEVLYLEEHRAWLVYDTNQLLFETVLHDERLETDDPVRSIELVRSPGFRDNQGNRAFYGGLSDLQFELPGSAQPWLGFRRLQDYMNITASFRRLPHG